MQPVDGRFHVAHTRPQIASFKPRGDRDERREVFAGQLLLNYGDRCNNTRLEFRDLCTRHRNLVRTGIFAVRKVTMRLSPPAELPNLKRIVQHLAGG